MTIATQLKTSGVAEVLVMLDPATVGNSTATEAAAHRVTKHFTSSELAHDKQLLRAFAPDTPKTRRGITPIAARSTRAFRVYPHLGIVYGTVDRAGLSRLRNAPGVKQVLAAPELSLVKPIHREAAAATGRITWGLTRLGVPALWKKGLTGKGVLVGHLDTGVDASHRALKGAIAQYAEFDWIGNQVPRAKPTDPDGHGTHTAGTIAARTVDGVSFGVAPDATLASALVIEGGNVIARVLGGMNWAVGRRVRVISMSLGIRGVNESFRPLVRRLTTLGILPVFAVGNEGPGTSRSPGNYAEALSVGASDRNDFVADFSSSKRFLRTKDPLVPDLMGPGVDVLSCVPSGEFELMDGTSMATPHIAGLAALLIQAVPKVTVAKLERAIFDSCSRPATMPKTRANRGIPNGPRALAWLGG